MLRSRARRCSMRLPRRDISPVSGGSNPAISRSVVLLPLPEGPNRTSVSPAPMEKLTSSRTCSEPNHLLKPRTTTDCRALVSEAIQDRAVWKEAAISPAISYLTFDCGLRIADCGFFGVNLHSSLRRRSLRLERLHQKSAIRNPQSSIRLLLQFLPREQYQREDRDRDRRQYGG